jgi:hypothetical protein
MDQVAELTRRVARLDLGAGDTRTPDGSVRGFQKFIGVMDEITETTYDFDSAAATSPETADAIADTSVLLSRLRDISPEIVDGPISPGNQFWISTGKPPTVAEPAPWPSQRNFIDAETATSQYASTKPFWIGLYTSTGLATTHGMWELYLDTIQSTLFPKPWHIWAIQPDSAVKVREISSAASWAEFVCTYPRRQGSLVYPDWQSASGTYEAVHVTLRAVAAMQGIYLRTGDQIIAPSFWGLESTLWLRWCFQPPELMAVRAN